MFHHLKYPKQSADFEIQNSTNQSRTVCLLIESIATDEEQTLAVS